ncbi:MAG: hypothetical protein Q4C63_05565 [Eubacteriales bacterium]|nr:hypothetical protein [Eubacteriales bacterium]
MNTGNYTKRTEAFLNTFLEKEGYSLIRTEFVEEDHNWYLRAYIDLTAEEYEKRLKKKQEALAAEKGEAAEATEPAGTADEALLQDASAEDEAETELPGIGINDCVKVSRRLSKWLDQEDFIKEVYTLEVCSKGFL